MNNTDLYIEYEDGNMNPQQENEFFQKLASDKSFRSEYKSFQTISSSVKYRSAIVLPSDELTASVFASLGVEMEPVVALPFYKKTFFRNCIMSAIVSLLTFVIAWYMFRNEDIDIEAKVSSKEFYLQNNDNNTTKISKQAGVVEQKNNSENINSNVDTISRIVYIDKSKEDKNISENNSIEKSKIQSNNHELIEFASAINYIDTPFDSQVKLNIENLNRVENIESISYSPLFANFFKPDIDVEFSGSDYFNLYSNDAINVSIIGNLNLAILKNFNKKWSGGVEYRYETFYGKFYDSSSENLNSFTQDNFSTLTINARYKMIDHQKYAVFSELGIGGNPTGVIVRPEFGMDIYSLSRLTIRIGIDYSLFAYNSQSDWFLASKIGLNYGVKFNF